MTIQTSAFQPSVIRLINSVCTDSDETMYLTGMLDIPENIFTNHDNENLVEDVEDILQQYRNFNIKAVESGLGGHCDNLTDVEARYTAVISESDPRVLNLGLDGSYNFSPAYAKENSSYVRLPDADLDYLTDVVLSIHNGWVDDIYSPTYTQAFKFTHALCGEVRHALRTGEVELEDIHKPGGKIPHSIDYYLARDIITFTKHEGYTDVEHALASIEVVEIFSRIFNAVMEKRSTPNYMYEAPMLPGSTHHSYNISYAVDTDNNWIDIYVKEDTSNRNYPDVYIEHFRIARTSRSDSSFITYVFTCLSTLVYKY